jgi:hypothetical protein
MITLHTAYLVAGVVIILYLLYKNREYKSKIAKPEVHNIDTSGIASNPPEFIDILQNKTINFLIGKEKIVISQISIGEGFSKINLISSLYTNLYNLNEQIPKNEVEKFKLNMQKTRAYNLIVKYVYNLSKPFAKKKRVFKKEFFNLSKNPEKMFLICEQIIDYWIYIKKLQALLAKGRTGKMINGEWFTWNSCEMDIDGKRIFKPRYGLSMN